MNMIKDIMFFAVGYIGIALIIILLVYAIIMFILRKIKFFHNVFVMYDKVKKYKYLEKGNYLIIDVDAKCANNNNGMSTDEKIETLTKTIDSMKRFKEIEEKYSKKPEFKTNKLNIK